MQIDFVGIGALLQLVMDDLDRIDLCSDIGEVDVGAKVVVFQSNERRHHAQVILYAMIEFTHQRVFLLV
jgi:hypothetical protein